MKTLYIETKMGIAGDMLMSALFELCDEKKAFLDTMNSLFPGVIEVTPVADCKCGINGTHMKVIVLGQEEGPNHNPDIDHTHNHQHSSMGHQKTSNESRAKHSHYSYSNIIEEINQLPVSDWVKKNASLVYKKLASAEAAVHGTTIEQIHFHEVGSLDAIADVIGSCILIEALKVDYIYASPVHVGNGTVICAHGILPVPAPATAELLKGIPYYTGQIDSELCTPTGAALLSHFCKDYGNMKPMKVEKIGIGLGTKDFQIVNGLRVFMGQLEIKDERDLIYEISCNLDDMTGEALGFTMDLLLKEGALDVYYDSIQMKKNRPGIHLHCLCSAEKLDYFAKLILKNTTTRGVRYQSFERMKLTSSIEEIDTPYGIIRNKISSGYDVKKSKLEYEDLKKIALEKNVSIYEIMKNIKV